MGRCGSFKVVRRPASILFSPLWRPKTLKLFVVVVFLTFTGHSDLIDPIYGEYHMKADVQTIPKMWWFSMLRWSSEWIYWKAVILYFRFDRIKSYWWKRQKKKRKHTCTRILSIKTHLRECMCIVYVCRWSIKLKQIFMQTLCVQTKFLNPVPVATIKNTTKVWCQCSNAKIGFHQLPTNRTPTIQVEWQDRYIVILM